MGTSKDPVNGTEPFDVPNSFYQVLVILISLNRSSLIIRESVLHLCQRIIFMPAHYISARCGNSQLYSLH